MFEDDFPGDTPEADWATMTAELLLDCPPSEPISDDDLRRVFGEEDRDDVIESVVVGFGAVSSGMAR